MHILLHFKNDNSYKFEELKELTNLPSAELTKVLETQIKKRRLVKRRDNYSLKPIFKIGKLDLKEHFGFLLQEDKDLYIDKKHFSDALDVDVVLVRAGVENKILEVLERQVHKMVCTVKRINRKTLIFPEKDIRLPIELTSYQGLLDGDVIYVEFIEFNERYIKANLLEVIGHLTDPDIDILAIVYSYGFPNSFSEEALEEAENIDPTIDFTHRLFVEDEFIVTIDGEDAKDLDDAISLKIVDDNYHLSVHIADVSNYVTPGSHIDSDAYKKATSAYLADRVIPMLPRRLSNDLCSLNVGEPKYTLSVFITLDKLGNIINHDIKETIINVNQRLSYNQVNAYFNNEIKLDEDVALMLDNMLKLSELLQNKRHDRGSLNFISEEYTYILDEHNFIKDIILRKSGLSEEIIESFMVLTNEVVSEHLTHLDLPTVYRTHPKPQLEKLHNLFNELKEYGITPPKHKTITGKTLQAILESVKDDPLEMIIHDLMLKSMSKAKYDMNNVGHFGLASRYYSHFTAPIRRYPDLLLHRLVKDYLINPVKIDKKIKYYEQEIPKIASHSSEMEKLAETIEREVDKLKIAEFMETKINEEFSGVISGFINAGFFVRIDKGIEGFVPYRLTDNISLNDQGVVKLGEKPEVLKMGSSVDVKLYDVNKALRQITFELI